MYIRDVLLLALEGQDRRSSSIFFDFLGHLLHLRPFSRVMYFHPIQVPPFYHPSSNWPSRHTSPLSTDHLDNVRRSTSPSIATYSSRSIPASIVERRFHSILTSYCSSHLILLFPSCLRTSTMSSNDFFGTSRLFASWFFISCFIYVQYHTSSSSLESSDSFVHLLISGSCFQSMFAGSTVATLRAGSGAS